MITYLIESNRLIKIGKTTNLDNRLTSCFTHNTKFQILMVMEGDHESHLHRVFKSHRKKGEWFELTLGDYLRIFVYFKQHIIEENLLSVAPPSSYTIDTVCGLIQKSKEELPIEAYPEDGIIIGTDLEIIGYKPTANNCFVLHYYKTKETANHGCLERIPFPATLDCTFSLVKSPFKSYHHE